MKNVIKASKNVTKEQMRAFITGNDTLKMADFVDKQIHVDAWAVLADTSVDGDSFRYLVEIISGGEVYAAMSHTFYDSFMNLVTFKEMYDEQITDITVTSGYSASGNMFIECKEC